MYWNPSVYTPLDFEWMGYALINFIVVILEKTLLLVHLILLDFQCHWKPKLSQFSLYTLCLLSFHWVKINNKHQVVILEYIWWYRRWYRRWFHDHSFHDLPSPGPLVHLKRWRSYNGLLRSHHKKFRRIFNGMGKCSLYKVQ